MYAVTFFMPSIDIRLLYARLTVAAVGVMAIMPSVVGCCAMAAPVVGQLMMGAGIIAAYAFVMKPRGK